MRSNTLLAIPVAIALAVAVPPGAASAVGPVAVSCGAALTTNAVLSADLACPAGGGITITGNVTVDLGGHLLSGPGTEGTAITVQTGSSPQIKNGRIDNWGAGIENTNPTGAPDQPATVTISAVQFRNNSTAVGPSSSFPFGTSPGYLIKNSFFEQNVSGIAGVFTGTIKVTGSTFRKNQFAISLDTAALDVAASRFNGNGTAIRCVESGCAIRTSYLVDNQTALASNIFGMTVRGNILSRNGVAISSGNSTGNAISHNVIIGNTTGVEFYLGGGTVNRNSFSGNDVGFTSQGGEDPFTATVEANSFTRNGSGIFIEDGGISLKGNIAKNNTEWGIYAPLSIDLGGNRASGNGNSPQCVGVVC